MPESIRDENTSKTLKIDTHGEARVATYFEGTAVSSAAPFPVDIIRGSVSIQASEIEIGKVVIKDDDSENTVTVDASGNLQADINNVVSVDATGQGDIPITLDSEAVTVRQGTASNLNTINKAVLIPYEYDYIDFNYTDDDLTEIIYKTGGAGGSTVATLTIAYSGGKLNTITKS